MAQFSGCFVDGKMENGVNNILVSTIVVESLIMQVIVLLKDNHVRDAVWFMVWNVDFLVYWSHRKFSFVPIKFVFAAEIQSTFKYCSWCMIPLSEDDISGVKSTEKVLNWVTFLTRPTQTILSNNG